MSSWAGEVKGADDPYESLETRMKDFIRNWIGTRLAAGGWESLGYHCSTLAILLGLVEQEDEKTGLAYLAQHMQSCFPNNPSAPRNDDPEAFNRQLITPYFAHYVLPLFIERGEMDFVLQQYRTCWGWMLEGGRTTWIEVFDERWSHAHQWSGCPTWQLSRYGLGLHPRMDLGPATFDVGLRPGSLPAASGRIPHPAGGWIDISWNRHAGGFDYTLSCDNPIQLNMPDGEVRAVETSVSLTLPEGPDSTKCVPRSSA